MNTLNKLSRMEEFLSKDTLYVCKISRRTNKSYSYCSINILYTNSKGAIYN